MDQYLAGERYAIGERVAELFRWAFIAVLFLLANLGGVGVPGQRLFVNGLLSGWAIANLVITIALVRGYRPGRRFGLWTLVVDLLFSVSLIYVTDGFSSPFFLAFFLAIIASSVRFGMLAGVASALAIAVMFLVTGGVAPVLLRHPLSAFENQLELLGKVFLFLVVAVISGLVVQELERERRLAISRAAEAEALHRISVSLASSLETETVLRVILEQAMSMSSGTQGALVVIVDREPRILTSIGTQGDDIVSAHLDALRAAAGGQPQMSEDARLMAVPVGEGGGALLLLGEPGSFTKQQFFRVNALAATAAVPLSNALRYQQRAQEATTDGLTGLLNNREFRRRLASEHSRFARQGTSFGLLLIDFDHFKAVNDSLGHQHGDRVLQAGADVLRRTIRAHDIPARYGGDEMAVIAMHVSAREAADLGVRLLDEVRRAQIPAGADRFLTFSIGVAVCPDDAASIEELVMAADQALYLAKRQGRNRCAMSSQLVTAFQTDVGKLTDALKDAGPLVALAAARALDWQGRQAGTHSSRVSSAAVALATKLGRGFEELEAVRLVALLHELPEHPQVGSVEQLLGPKFPAVVTKSIEALGNVYNGGDVRGAPLPARIVALADRYDELVSGRKGTPGLSPSEAVEKLRDEGRDFDPPLVEALQELAPQRPLLHTDTIVPQVSAPR